MTDADNEDTQGVIIMPDADNEDTQDVIKPITVTAKEYAQSYEFAPLNEPLGAIVMVFAQLETKLTMTIDALLGIDHPAGTALEDLMQSVRTRIKLFQSSVTQWLGKGDEGLITRRRWWRLIPRQRRRTLIARQLDDAQLG